jgi:spermidine synthase
VSDTAARVQQSNNSPRHRRAVAACFFLSGAAALIYQTAWTRQFALVFGTSELAVATVLAAYMTGLALGAWLIEGVLPRIRRPIRTYAVLELGIALAGIALVPLCLATGEWILVRLLGGLPEPLAAVQAGITLYYLVASFLTLLVPTVLMGATLPILAREGVRRTEEIGPRIGALYAWNTAGGVLGALGTALWLLPSLGLRASEWVAAGINLLVCLVATTAIGESPVTVSATPATCEPPRSGAGGAEATLAGAAWVLPLMLLSGAVAFTHEVLWTRLLQRVVGASVLAFGVMVASFLLGIALGGAWGARLARTRSAALRAWIGAELAAAALAFATWYLVISWNGAQAAFWARAGFGLLALLPLSVAIGLTYPLAVRILANDAAAAPLASARVYAWNTLGAILGALGAGFVVIPALRYEGTLASCAAASGVLAMGAALLWRPADWRWTGAAGAVLATAALVLQPEAPAALLSSSPVRTSNGTLYYYAVGRSADVVVLREPRALGIMTNGLPEAAAPLRGDITSTGVEAWMAAIAVLARPELRDLLVVGFGGGNVINGVPPTVRAIDVIELEPEVIGANRAIAALRNQDPLADGRVNLIFNDARGALTLTNRRYDAILSQPSHPWTAGASHLYTREFLQQARDHLRPGGLFVQWMDAAFVDGELLRSLLATQLAVFAEVRLYRPSATELLLVAADRPVEPERHWRETGAVLDGAALHFARLGLAAPEDLLATLALETVDAARLARGAAPITDDDNRLATAAVQERRSGLSAARLDQLLAPYDPLGRPDGFVLRGLREQIAFDYVWRGIALGARHGAETAARRERLAAALGDTEEGAYLRYLQAQQGQRASDAARLLDAALERWPSSVTWRYAVVDQGIGELSSGQVSPTLRAAIARLPPEPAQVIDALGAAVRQDWGAVAAADAALAAVRWTAPWGLQAAQLRAEWRARVHNPELRRRYGDEGIRICDRALAVQPTVFWYALRALNGVAAERSDVALESIAGFAENARDALRQLEPSGQALIRAQAENLAGLLAGLEQVPGVDAARLTEVRAMLRDAVGGRT